MSQIIIQGLALSGLYALVAVGFTMIFSVGRVLNLAHGAYLMLGGYVYYTSVQLLGLPKAGGILLAMAASWVVLGGLLLFVHRTRTGRAIQAVSMDRKGALICGIDPLRMNLVTWAVSGALAALAGVFFATYTQLHPGMWVAPLIIAVAVVIVGGIGSIVGSLVVAHVIGSMETATTTLIAAELRGVFTMALIIVVLIVAPRGLFGRREL